MNIPVEPRPPVPPFSLETAVLFKSSQSGRRLERAQPSESGPRLYDRQPLAESERVLAGSSSDHRVPCAKMGEGSGLQVDQRTLGILWRQNRSPLRL